jgi:hypothetical protein
MAEVAGARIDLLTVFVWAARHGRNMCTAQHPEPLQRFVLGDLIAISNSAILSQDARIRAQVSNIWRGFFAPLLSSAYQALRPAVLIALMEPGALPEPKWPVFMRAFTNIFNDASTATEAGSIPELLDEGLLHSLLQELLEARSSALSSTNCESS